MEHGDAVDVFLGVIEVCDGFVLEFEGVFGGDSDDAVVG